MPQTTDGHLTMFPVSLSRHEQPAVSRHTLRANDINHRLPCGPIQARRVCFFLFLFVPIGGFVGPFSLSRVRGHQNRYRGATIVCVSSLPSRTAFAAVPTT
jgi:hypothetical protein